MAGWLAGVSKGGGVSSARTSASSFRSRSLRRSKVVSLTEESAVSALEELGVEIPDSPFVVVSRPSESMSYLARVLNDEVDDEV